MSDAADQPSDEILMRRVAGGERDALCILVARHGAKVRRLAARVLGSAEDAVNDATTTAGVACRLCDETAPEPGGCQLGARRLYSFDR